jgi:hypothetical protein
MTTTVWPDDPAPPPPIDQARTRMTVLIIVTVASFAVTVGVALGLVLFDVGFNRISALVLTGLVVLTAFAAVTTVRFIGTVRYVMQRAPGVRVDARGHHVRHRRRLTIRPADRWWLTLHDRQTGDRLAAIEVERSFAMACTTPQEVVVHADHRIHLLERDGRCWWPMHPARELPRTATPLG